MLGIVIPYFKITFFEETLKSLANQTNKRFKVYIGDDASPENPKALLDTYKGEFDFEYRRFEDNLGGTELVKQWERCIDMAEDENWLMVLGDDDYLEEHAVASWYEHYDFFNQKTEVIRFASKLISTETNHVSDVFEHPVWESATDAFYRKLQNITRSSLSEYIFSKESYLEYGFYNFPLGWYSDDRAWLEFSKSKPIYTINKAVVAVRLSSSSISGNDNYALEKDLATLKFYEFLVSKKLKFYNKLQRHKLLDIYENNIKKVRHVYWHEWFFIMFMYLKYYDKYSFNKVVKRFIKAILRYEH